MSDEAHCSGLLRHLDSCGVRLWSTRTNPQAMHREIRGGLERACLLSATAAAGDYPQSE
jgi:hypothetical protein